MLEDSERLQERIDSLESELAQLKRINGVRGTRKRSHMSLAGLPLYDIALGPDPERNEVRGHAQGVIAIGDIATGVVAMGGLARGFVAFGGLALGGIAIGGAGIGVLLGVGGLAIGAFAWGGGAVGVVAAGGLAVGYYACGGVALGRYVVSSMHIDPEAMRFFGRWIPEALGIDLPQPPGR